MQTTYTRLMRSLPAWVGSLVFLLALLVVIAWAVRRGEARLAFFPFSGEDVTPRAFGIAYQPLTIPTADGERLRAWHLPRDDARARVIYFHGNGGNLSLWCDVYTGLWQQGFEVLAIDYRGYGLSTGSPSERGLYRDVDASLDYAETLPRHKLPIIYWGRSLGTAMAAYAASQHPPDAVVLEAAFPSMRSVLETNPILWALSWASSYRFPTAEWMANVRRPTLLLHGDRDEVIPYRLGQRLYASLQGPKTFFTKAGGDHNEPVPPDAESYWRSIHEFVESVRGNEGKRGDQETRQN